MTDTGTKNRGYKQKAVIRLSELLNMTMSILLKWTLSTVDIKQTYVFTFNKMSQEISRPHSGSNNMKPGVWQPSVSMCFVNISQRWSCEKTAQFLKGRRSMEGERQESIVRKHSALLPFSHYVQGFAQEMLRPRLFSEETFPRTWVFSPQFPLFLLSSNDSDRMSGGSHHHTVSKPEIWDFKGHLITFRTPYVQSEKIWHLTNLFISNITKKRICSIASRVWLKIISIVKNEKYVFLITRNHTSFMLDGKK